MGKRLRTRWNMASYPPHLIFGAVSAMEPPAALACRATRSTSRTRLGQQTPRPKHPSPTRRALQKPPWPILERSPFQPPWQVRSIADFRRRVASCTEAPSSVESDLRCEGGDNCERMEVVERPSATLPTKHARIAASPSRAWRGETLFTTWTET